MKESDWQIIHNQIENDIRRSHLRWELAGGPCTGLKRQYIGKNLK